MAVTDEVDDSDRRTSILPSLAAQDRNFNIMSSANGDLVIQLPRCPTSETHMRKKSIQWMVAPLIPGDWFWTRGPLGRVVGIEGNMLRYQWLMINGELSVETRRMRIDRIVGTPPIDCIPGKFWRDVRDLSRWGTNNWLAA